ncbi:MAG: hypothetical protein NVS4B2_23550 [Chloroflexota bacterium]
MSLQAAPPHSVQGFVAQLLSPYRVLRGNRSLDLFIGGQGVSIVGNMLYSVALTILAYDLTKSATAVAFLSFTRLLPYAVLLPVSGVIVDRWDRTRVMIVADLARTVCMLGLMTIQSRATLLIAFPLVFLNAALSTLYLPGYRAMIPDLVEADELIEANAVLSQIANMGTVLGPALGGVLVLLGDTRMAFLVNGVTYLISAVTLFYVHMPPRTQASGDEAESWLHRILFGFRFLATEDRGILLAIAVATAGVGLMGGAFGTVAIVMAVKEFHLGGQGNAYFNAAFGAGALAAGVLVGLVTTRLSVDRLFILGTAAEFALFALFGLSPFWWFGIIVLVFYGLGDVLSEIAGTTATQTVTPHEFLGRVSSASDSILTFSTLLGSLIVGPVLDLAGPRATTLIFAAVGSGVFVLTLPGLGRMGEVLRTLAFVHEVQPFATLPPALLNDLPGHLTLMRFEAGATVIKEGEEGDGLYIVKSGELEVMTRGEGQKLSMATTLSRSAYFGETALLRHIPQAESVRAGEASEIYRLSRTDFDLLVRSSPDFARSVTDMGYRQHAVVPRKVLLHP